MDMNTCNINAAGMPGTIGTSRKISSTIPRMQALRELLKDLSNQVTYTYVNGIPMPVPRG